MVAHLAQNVHSLRVLSPRAPKCLQFQEKRTLEFLGNVIWMYHSMVATLTIIILFIEIFKFIFKKSKVKQIFKKKNWNSFLKYFFQHEIWKNN
jgi:hypothetical protein